MSFKISENIAIGPPPPHTHTKLSADPDSPNYMWHGNIVARGAEWIAQYSFEKGTKFNDSPKSPKIWLLKTDMVKNSIFLR